MSMSTTQEKRYRAGWGKPTKVILALIILLGLVAGAGSSISLALSHAQEGVEKSFLYYVGMSLGPPAITALIAVVTFFTMLGKDYVALGEQELRFVTGRKELEIPWETITGLEQRRVSPRIGRDFDAFIVRTTGEDAYFCDSGGLFDDWLPDELRLSQGGLLGVEVKWAGELRDTVLARAKIQPSGDKTRSCSVAEDPQELPAATSRTKQPTHMGFMEYALAGLLTLALPLATVLLFTLALPWSAAPQQVAGELVFRYSAVGLAAMMGPTFVLFLFPLVGMVAIGGFLRVLRRTSRPMAWVSFWLLGLPLCLLLGLSTPRGYSPDAHVDLGKQQLEILDSIDGRDQHLLIPWSQVCRVRDDRHFPRRQRSCRSVRPCKAAPIVDRQGGRTSTGKLFISTESSTYRLPNAFQGYQRLVQELIQRAGLKCRQ